MYYELPNIFTPNGSDLNELFVPISMKNVSQANIEIFGRWGNLVYESDEIMIYWNGEDQNGNEVGEGTYFYVATVKDTLGNEHNMSGTITLIIILKNLSKRFLSIPLKGHTDHFPSRQI